MTDDELKEIEARANAAIQGVDPIRQLMTVAELEIHGLLAEDIPKLVAEVRRLNKFLEAYEAAKHITPEDFQALLHSPSIPTTGVKTALSESAKSSKSQDSEGEFTDS